MPKLVDQSLEPTLVHHFVEARSFGKQTGNFCTQKQSFDGNVALRNVGRDNQKAETINPALNSGIGLFAGNHSKQ